MAHQPPEVLLSQFDDPWEEGCRAWVGQVLSADFSELPDDPTEDELTAVSFAFNGYEVAERMEFFGLELLEWAGVRLDAFQESGEWPDSSLELWLILFALQRQHRLITGSGPAGDDFLGLWRAVYLGWRDAIRYERSAERTPEERRSAPVYIPYAQHQGQTPRSEGSERGEAKGDRGEAKGDIPDSIV